MGKISFFFKEAFGSLRRNYFMTVAALVTVFLSIVVLGGVLVFVFTTDALLAGVEQKVEITVYLKTNPDPTQDEITAMQTAIYPGWKDVVKSCTFVSKEEALQRVKDWFKDKPEVLENLTGNPLPASFEISLVDPQSVSLVADRIQSQWAPLIDDVKFGEEYTQKLFGFTNSMRLFMLVFIVLLGIVAILLISNTIRLSIFARKREVEIMKLVGATNWFIRWPFVIEGVTVGFFGALAAAVVVLLLNHYLAGWLRNAIPFVAVPLDAVPFVLVTIVLLGVGVVIGALGSAIGLRRFLKV